MMAAALHLSATGVFLPLGQTPGSYAMIKWAIIFAIIGLVAGVLGFTGLAGAAMGIAKFLFWAAVIIAIILFVLGMTVYKKLT